MKPPTFLRTALTLLGVATLAACADQPLDPRAAQPDGPALTVIPTNALASIDAGTTHSCGLTSAGQGWCWGRNAVGQLGDSTAATTTVPVAVYHPAGVTFTQVSAGAIHTCAITAAGQAYCWGANGDGRLGDSTTVLPLMPVAVKPLGAIAFTSISAGNTHTCGLNGSGQAYCWGNNSSAQIGDSTHCCPADVS